MSSKQKGVLKFAPHSLHVDIISKQRQSVMQQKMEAVVSFASGDADARGQGEQCHRLAMHSRGINIEQTNDVWFSRYASGQTDRHKHADYNTSHPYWSKVTKIWLINS